MHRHESLRTRIVSVDGVPIQHVDAAGDYHLNVVDLTAIPPAKVEMEARSMVQEFADRKVAFSVGPLCDPLVLKLSGREHVFVLILDHMISDVSSFQIVTREIWTVYKQLVQGLAPSLPHLPLQFADYAIWQEQTRELWLEQHEAFWRAHLAGVQPLKVPLDRPNAGAGQPSTEMLQFSLGRDLSGQLRDLAAREGIRPALVVLTLYVAAMSLWCERQDMIFTIAAHGRNRPDLKAMVGYLATIPHFRVEVRPQEDMLDLVKRIVQEFESSYREHWDYDRVPHLIPECATELNFNWLPTSANFHLLPTNWAFNPTDLFAAPAECPQGQGMLDIQAFPLRAIWSHKFMPFFFDNGGVDIRLGIAHQPDLITAGTVERFVQNLRLFAIDLLSCANSTSTRGRVPR